MFSSSCDNALQGKTVARTKLYVNSRVMNVPSNGQKRVAQEVMARLGESVALSPPLKLSSGFGGHLWEQIVLPLRSCNGPLWSPSTSGPIAHPNHIVTIHDIAFVDGSQWFSRSFASLYRTVTREIVKSSRHIAVVSNFTKDRLVDVYRVSPEKITVIYSGVSESFRDCGNEGSELIQSKFGVSGRYLIAFMGHDPRKNVHRVYEAWSKVHCDFPDATLVTFGRMSNRNVFEHADDRTPGAGIVHVGAVSDDELAKLYSGAVGLVFPSLYEGFGLPVIEASACGCRVITSNRTALPEVSAPDTILIDPTDSDDIRKAMITLLESHDSADSRRGRIASTRRFSWDNAAAQYAQLFDRHFY